MYSTTLRLNNDLARFLQEEAQVNHTSVNALLALLVEKARDARARERLAMDWASYAKDEAAQNVAYAFPAQSELAAEPIAKSYNTEEPR